MKIKASSDGILKDILKEELSKNIQDISKDKMHFIILMVLNLKIIMK